MPPGILWEFRIWANERTWFCPRGRVVEWAGGAKARHDGDKRVRMGVEPAEERIVELAQGAHLGLEGVSGQVLDVLEAGGDGGVAGERED
ncbi:unnamed protein product [Prunus armeniaca]|uniref:Uncharacterized protein n=1 Tax=Prunus armeniaca TaxID=36596 RepID=A0A6J5X0Y2_PRUAR|nr:unnamed protein product [Prunus armeniaca]